VRKELYKGVNKIILIFTSGTNTSKWVTEVEEKTLMMIVGQEGGRPKWWVRAWASKVIDEL
jgi:hypothetical protein